MEILIYIFGMLSGVGVTYFYYTYKDEIDGKVSAIRGKVAETLPDKPLPETQSVESKALAVSDEHGRYVVAVGDFICYQGNSLTKAKEQRNKWRSEGQDAHLIVDGIDRG